MLVPAPYQGSKKKAKKDGQEERSGLRRKGTSVATSEDTKTHYSPTENDEEEKDSNSPPEGGRKKRAACIDPEAEAEASKKGKVSPADNSVWDIDSSSEWRPRD